jgi:hypothetical protein
MSTQKKKDRLELLQGTLDLLILRTLIFGPQHGQGIGRAIQQTTGDKLLVERGALSPALQRLEARGWIAAEWGDLLEQPQGALLHAHATGPQTARQRDDQLAATGGGHRAGSGPRGRGG